MADLLFSLNAVAPLFLVMLLGFMLKRQGFINDSFVNTGTKLCFNVALPSLLVLNIMGSNLAEAFDLPLVLFCVGGIAVFVLFMRLLMPRFIRDTSTCSAFIQVCFRSNYVLLGLPFIYNISGSAGVAMASTVLAFMIPLFNILAVLVLAENQKHDQEQYAQFKRIATNPLIIAAVLGIVGSILPFSLPILVERPLAYIADMAMPLALLTIGGAIDYNGERQKVRLALTASFVKLVALPLVALAVAIMMGFKSTQLCVILALFAGPPAVSCFPMAFQMGADYHFTSLTVLLATSFAAITMFLTVFALRVMGMI